MFQSITFTLPSRQTLRYALFGGVIHLSIAGFLWFYFNISTRVDLVLPYIVVGVVLIGVIPAMLLATKRLVTPLLVVAGALVASAYLSYRYAFAPSVAFLPTVAPSGLPYSPFDWYLHGWVIMAAVALIAGGGEYRIRHLRKTQ